jgi:hypothetical protein
MSDMDESAPVKAGAPSSEQHDAGRDADPTQVWKHTTCRPHRDQSSVETRWVNCDGAALTVSPLRIGTMCGGSHVCGKGHKECVHAP